MISFVKTGLIVLLLSGTVKAQLPPVFEPARAQTTQTTETVRRYLAPVKITWRTQNAGDHITNAERLLLPGNGQADLANKNIINYMGFLITVWGIMTIFIFKSKNLAKNERQKKTSP